MPLLDYPSLATSVIAGAALTPPQALEVLQGPDAEFLSLFAAAAAVRHRFHANRVQVQILSNARSGNCSEDCHYCSQSAISTAPIIRYPMKPPEQLLAEARQAKSLQARRFCMGISGRSPTDDQIDQLCRVVTRIRQELEMPVCCSLGFLTPPQARRLFLAGLDRVNHNLNTSRRHYPAICTTHTFADRLANLMLCRDAGLEICSGGIIGQGETDQDIVDMLLALKPVRPASVPINFIVPIAGTPFENMQHGLTPVRCLRVLALARLLHPQADIRAAGGREYHLRSLQPMALYIANSIFSNGYLTAGGQEHDQAVQMIHDLGFELEIED